MASTLDQLINEVLILVFTAIEAMLSAYYLLFLAFFLALFISLIFKYFEGQAKIR